MSFFPRRPEASPQIYAYMFPDVETHKGYIKIGYTERDPETRIKEQLRTARLRYKILLTESAVRSDGTIFTDKDVHALLLKNNFPRIENGEWFKCSIDDVRAAIIAVKER